MHGESGCVYFNGGEDLNAPGAGHCGLCISTLYRVIFV